MNEQLILDRIGVILNKMHQNKQLQSLAKEKGLPVKGLELNDDTEKQLSVSVIALMLAKMEGDGRYKRLSDMGMQKRSLKVEIINDYKDRANMLLNKYKNQPEEPTEDDDDFSEAYKIDDIDDYYFDESHKDSPELTVDSKCKQFIIDKIHELVPDAEPLSIRGFINKHAYSVEWFANLNGKKYQCYDLSDEEIIDDDELMKINKEIAYKLREQPGYDSENGNRYDIDLTNAGINESYVDDIVEEGFGFTTKKNICNRLCEQIDLINPFIKDLNKLLKDNKINTPKEFQKWYRLDVRTSYGYGGGSTSYGDTYGGTTVSYTVGDPTLESYITRAIQIFKMSTRDRYNGKIFSNEEFTDLKRSYELLKQMKKDMSEACHDNFNAYKEYKPKEWKALIHTISEEVEEWIDISEKVYEFASNKT